MAHNGTRLYIRAIPRLLIINISSDIGTIEWEAATDAITNEN